MKAIISILVGFFAAILVIFLVEYLSHLMYPMPEGLDYNDKQAMDQWIKTLPIGAMLMVLLAWFLGAMAGVFVASYFDELNVLRSSIYVAFFLLIATVINLYQISHPTWMWFAGILSILAGCSFGVKMFIRYWAKTQIVNGKWTK